MADKLVDLVLKNGTVVMETECVRADIVVDDGRIIGIAENTDQLTAEKIIDCTGKIILPGAIDTHSHFFEPGETSKYRDDFHTGTMAAAAGGYTTCIEMPQSIPPVVTADAFKLKLGIANKKAVVDFALWGGLVPSKFNQIQSLHKIGCAGFKAFTSDAGPDYEMCEDADLVLGMQKIKELNSVIGIHAENNSICNRLTDYYKENGANNPLNHEASRPYYAELEAVQRCILFSKITGAKVMICHLSTPEGAEKIKDAKREKVPVYAETCSHYLLFDTDTLKLCGAFARCNPPLRSKARKEKLWESIFDGSIDCIGSDHAAYSEEEKMKAKNIFEAPCGFPGIQLILPGLLTEGVNHRGLGLVRFAQLTSTNAAKLFGLYPKKGHIGIGADGDFAIVDLHSNWTYHGRDSFSKGKSDKYPHEGKTYEAKIEKTIVRGTVVYENERIVVEPGYGDFINPRLIK